MNNKIVVYKDTKDNWYPPYYRKGFEENIPMVCVIYHHKIDTEEPYAYRTSVWGADDLGMGFDSASEGTAYQKFIEVISLPTVNIEDLKMLGFVSC